MTGRPKAMECLLMLLINFSLQACVSCNSTWEMVPAVPGTNLTLDCTYNCSSGFVKGDWIRSGQVVGCDGCRTTLTVSADLCTLSLTVQVDVVTNQNSLGYRCESCHSDQQGVPCKTERRVRLNISPSLKATSLPPSTAQLTTSSDGTPESTEADEHKVVMVLAVVTLVVVVVLTSCLCFLRCKGKRPAHREKTPASVLDRHRTGSVDVDYASVTFTNTDCQSDHEVPYAEIMITAPGASTPELRGLPSGAPGPSRPRWREDSGFGPLQHAFRSADLLHVQMPRDVCRKMSSTSEYAIITYS